MAIAQPIAAASQPGTRRVDYFALAAGSSGPQTVHWLPLIPSTTGPGWTDIGGEGWAIDAYWLGDGSELIVVVAGMDSRIWTNSLDPTTNLWAGWQSNPDGSLHDIVLAS